jgi:pyruvate dehydrogenase E2 component (dihydrolipoamide acetyltransferase)
MYDFKMPSMGADMTSATLVAWNVAVGERVEKGDILCEIETEKGNIDVEVWEPGVVTEFLVEPGQKVPVGEAIARLDDGEGAEAPSAPLAQEPPEEEPPVEEPTKKPPVEEPTKKPPVEEPTKKPPVEPPPSRKPPVEEPPARQPPPAEEPAPPTETMISGSSRLRDGPAASPAARRRAAELGLDLSTVTGSGPHGVVKLADLEGAAPPTEAAQPPTRTDDPSQALRDAIARAMARSKREIPHYYLQSTVDVTDTLAWLEALNAERGVKERILFGGLLVRAVALAAKEVPVMNGLYEDGRFEPAEAVHVGFAVAMRGGGVVAPAIHDVDRKSLDETMAATKDVVRRVRRGKLRSSEMTDSTITLTSLGDMGVDTVFGVIYPPQVAIVGAGSPREAAVARGGMVGVHTLVDLTLSGDHRVSDGMAGSEFLQAMARYLTDPEQLR